MCQEGFANEWNDTLYGTYTRCEWFGDELDQTDTLVGAYNLEGPHAEPYLETSEDQLFAEKLNLLLVATHGGIQSKGHYAVLAMCAKDTHAESRDMKFGDEDRGLSILALFACKTLSDAHYPGPDQFNRENYDMKSRWSYAFEGGLRQIHGSHGTIHSTWNNRSTLEEYADYLQKGKVMKYAWRDGLEDGPLAQDGAVLTTGRTSNECWNRHDNMKWQDFHTYDRLRGNTDNNYYCRTAWSDID